MGLCFPIQKIKIVRDLLSNTEIHLNVIDNMLTMKLNTSKPFGLYGRCLILSLRFIIIIVVIVVVVIIIIIIIISIFLMKWVYLILKWKYIFTFLITNFLLL
jgi:uncharacterized membrane protein